MVRVHCVSSPPPRGRKTMTSCSCFRRRPKRSVAESVTSFKSIQDPVKIGDGSFGEVFRVTVAKDKTKSQYALKVLDKAQVIQQGILPQVHSERDVLFQVGNHTSIVKLFSYWEGDLKLYFLMEFADAGDMFDIIKAQKKLTPAKCARYLLQLAGALDYVHKHRIIYRDMKLENIVLKSKGDLAVLADFGLAKQLKDQHINNTRTICGTIQYMSPEMLNDEAYGRGIDWWALGVTTFIMLTGTYPYSRGEGKLKLDNGAEDRQLMYKRISLGLIKFPESMEVENVVTLKLLLTPNPALRARTSGALRETEWLRNVNTMAGFDDQHSAQLKASRHVTFEKVTSRTEDVASVNKVKMEVDVEETPKLDPQIQIQPSTEQVQREAHTTIDIKTSPDTALETEIETEIESKSENKLQNKAGSETVVDESPSQTLAIEPIILTQPPTTTPIDNKDLFAADVDDPNRSLPPSPTASLSTFDGMKDGTDLLDMLSQVDTPPVTPMIAEDKPSQDTDVPDSEDVGAIPSPHNEDIVASPTLIELKPHHQDEYDHAAASDVTALARNVEVVTDDTTPNKMQEDDAEVAPMEVSFLIDKHESIENTTIDFNDTLGEVELLGRTLDFVEDSSELTTLNIKTDADGDLPTVPYENEDDNEDSLPPTPTDVSTPPSPVFFVSVSDVDLTPKSAWGSGLTSNNVSTPAKPSLRRSSGTSVSLNLELERPPMVRRATAADFRFASRRDIPATLNPTTHSSTSSDTQQDLPINTVKLKNRDLTESCL
eukprot:m.61989 g.61989  ORF g.61989 m.61989 type:complete len:771 (-) comp23066_c0_seq3:817-3129(-)